MAYCYFDESGQIGGDTANSGVSKDFYCALLITGNPKELEHCAKKTIKGFSPKQLKKFSGALHAYKELDKTRFRLLGLLAKTEAKVVLCRVDKAKLQRRFPTEGDVELYIHIVAKLFEKMTADGILTVSDKLVLSRFFVNKSQNDCLTESLVKKTGITDCCVTPANQDKCLQAVDFVAWAYYMKCERNDSSYIEAVSGNILAECEL